ncbi:toxin-activating lysine-acyltransferase [Roseomonas hellenica]|uniref:Toxin-activating lysine-acyltransferase n=1 Tax=Plastoroseomonas hellenica TaxID=2687306 RepID=A0ABS5EYL0_9PROT|nr:hypothetical protein [Plastoroseomonas hellenica]MBR0665384.1 toxin-activating lysine-acyltransferase [Plastoroseomonas hellenica]
MIMHAATAISDRRPVDHPAPGASLRLFRPGNPVTALGLAVGHLMTKAPFAQLPMGGWGRILVGQINRGHYYFVVNGENRVVGFLGWALTSEDRAEAWLLGRRGIGHDDAADGDCVVFNAWAADTAAVNRFVLDAARNVVRGRRLIYSKRYYQNGRVRPLRIGVNDFVGRHIDRLHA